MNTEQKEHIATDQSSQQDNWADSCAQKNREIWSGRAPLICFLSKSPKQSTRPEPPGAEEWLNCYYFCGVRVFRQTYLGFVFASTVRFLEPFFTSPPPFCHYRRPAALLCASASSCSSWAPILRETSQHCSVKSWKRTQGPTQSFAHSSRVCGHYAKHFLWFSEINVLTLNISTTFIMFIIVILLIACCIRAEKK